MSAMASQITTITSVYSNVYSDADQSKHQSSASLASVRGIHRLTVNSPHKGPVTRKMFPFDNVIMMIWTVRPDHFWFPTFWNVLKGCKYKSHIMVQLISAFAIYATNPIKVRHASESGLRDHNAQRPYVLNTMADDIFVVASIWNRRQQYRISSYQANVHIFPWLC